MGLLSQLALMVLSTSSEGADLIGPWAIPGGKNRDNIAIFLIAAIIAIIADKSR